MLRFFNNLKPPEIKAYGVVSWSKYAVERTFNGKRDHYGGFNHRQTLFYNTFWGAIRNGCVLLGRRRNQREGFVVAFACTIPEVKALAEKNCFSATIYAVYNYYELSCQPACEYGCAPACEHVEKATRRPNPNFNLRCLEGLLEELNQSENRCCTIL